MSRICLIFVNMRVCPRAYFSRAPQLVTDVLQANNVNPAVSTLVQVRLRQFRDRASQFPQNSPTCYRTLLAHAALQGGADVGAAMAADSRLPLISFTGSTAVGRSLRCSIEMNLVAAFLCLHGDVKCFRSVGAVVGKRLGKTILELGAPSRPCHTASQSYCCL